MQTLMAIADSYLLPGALWLVMFTIGLRLKPGDFAAILSGRRSFILGLISMLVLVPACGILLAVLFAPTPELMVGLILLATTPGGILSNLITDIAKGDVALSVSLTLALSGIYIFTLPFIAHFALLFAFQKSQPIQIPLGSSISHIMMVTLIPLSCGMFAAHLKPRWGREFGPRIKTAATAALVVVFAMIVVQQWAVLRASFGTLMAIVVAMNLAAITVGLTVCKLGRLTRRETIAIAVEHMIRQEGTAIFVAVTLLHRHDMSLPMIINTFIGMALCMTFFAVARRFRPAAPPASKTGCCLPHARQ
jgi:BASS family bile acid:Na+ symporter